MKVKNLKCIASALLVVLTAALNAQAWDGTGHMLVAQIAYDRLNDKARARVDELAAKLHKGDVPYNGINIACWPDDIKAVASDPQFRGLYKPWHYIDIGCNTNDPDVLAHPPALTPTNGDVIVALNHCVDLIKKNRPTRSCRMNRWPWPWSCTSSGTYISHCTPRRGIIPIQNPPIITRMMLAATA